MKNYRLIVVAILTVCCLTVSGQTKLSPNDSIMNAAQVKILTGKREQLKKKIATEDTKRNRVVSGVTPEVQETLNDEQDSICLELRSQLIAVELELKELVPDQTAITIINQLNLSNQNHSSNSGTSTEVKK